MIPPIIKGGQGRTEQDIRDSASGLVMWLVLVVLLCALAAAVDGAVNR